MTIENTIVNEAVSWLRTPFVKEASVKGVGIDCVQLGRAVGINTGVLPPSFPDFLPYPTGWLLERHDTRYHDALAAHLDLIWLLGTDPNPPPTPLPADLLLYRVGRAPAHSAIVEAWPTVIHACDDSECVVRASGAANVLGPRSRRLVSIWRVPRG
jgi:hypothetical protein